MRCPSCETDNPESARFCLNCGCRLVLTCPQCGTELPLEARFCLACGTQVDGPSPSDEQRRDEVAVEALKRLVPREFAQRLLAAQGRVGHERRVVTILFSDVKGSVKMAESLDPEEVLEVMDGAFDVLIEPIYRHEGTLVRMMGDAILAFFGAPIAHEDDPERACRAALEIVEGAQRYAARLERERGLPGFNVRVGINTGLVVVGEVGSDLRVEYTAMGDAINVAARMESAAEPGTILITGETHRLIAHSFETEALGPIQVKGKAAPIHVYRVLAARVAPGKLRGIAGLESPLVGRQAELRALGEAVERLQAGVGGIATIMGEAGLGKSRLVAEVRLQSANQQTGETAGLQWVEGRCLSHGTAIAYLLWLDVLRGLLGVTVEDSPVAVGDALQEWVQTLCPERFEGVYPFLGWLMSLPLQAKEEATMRELEGESLKLRTFHAVETFIECAAGRRPLVLVCEDLHWADPTSIELLEQLLALTDRAPLLLICIFRPQTEQGAWRIKEIAARLYRHRHTGLWLAPLSVAESEALVGNLLRVEGPHPEAVEGLPHDLKRRILSHAEGNPFYVEEIIRSLIDSRAIVPDEVTGHWQAAQDMADIAIPRTLHGVLMARIDRLPEETKRILQLAAVVGRIFLYRVLAAIAQEDRAGPEGNQRELDEHLLILQREGMIRERARVPELEYIFKHHLTQEAAYNSLLKRARRVFHRRVAEALEQLFPDRMDEQAGLLAHHWEQAEEPDKALNYLLPAGDRARRLGASLEAIGFYQSALQKAAALKAPSRTVELHHLHERLGDVYLVNLSRQDEALDHYASFLALAESEQDVARGARKVAGVHLARGDLTEAQKHYETALARLSSLPPLAEASRVHFGLASLLVYRNRLDEAEGHARASLEISDQIADARGLADANKVLGVIASRRGELEAACEYDEHSLGFYRELGDLPRTAQACNNVGDSYRLLGQMGRALERLNEGLKLARRIGDTRDEALLLTTMAELFLDQGQWETAIAHLERALPLAEESGVVARLIVVHRILGSAYEGAGQLAEARRHLETAETLSRDTQHLRFAPGIYLDLARLNATQGEFDEAERCVKLALDAAGPKPPDLFLGLMHRCYGYLRGRQGNVGEAVMHLEESLKILEQAHLPVEVGKTRLSLGTAYANRGQEGDRGRAREQLLAAMSHLRQIGAQRHLARAGAQVEELGYQWHNSDAWPGRDAPPAGNVAEKRQGG
ncbi:MAG: tetratricopeptide repeat protein [Anaerolineae bacterium]|nr:MAG: tetratricopeptide repeat protein [Anaerolineae bacterium]